MLNFGVKTASFGLRFRRIFKQIISTFLIFHAFIIGCLFLFRKSLPLQDYQIINLDAFAWLWIFDEKKACMYNTCMEVLL